MTSVPKDIHPDYCHSLSPTIGKWCPLLATDVHRLKTVGMFTDGRALYHFDNHPVKWVRVTGVVVAVDEFSNRRVFTVDDSSGMCIECPAITPPSPPRTTRPTAAPTLPPHLNQLAALMHGPTNIKTPLDDKAKTTKGDVQTTEGAGKEGGKTAPSVQTPSVRWEEVDVGRVVKVKGRVNHYRDTIQVEVIKIEVLRCTDQEVRCWNEAAAFKREVLSGPWVVTTEEEERCRKVRERELRHARKRRAVKDGRVERKGGEGRTGGAEERRKRKGELERREEDDDAQRREAREAERVKAKASSKTYLSMAVLKAAEGKYDALGI